MADELGQKYVVVDGEGRALAFYAANFSPSIPRYALPISDEIWAEWSQASQRKIWQDGVLADAPEPSPGPGPAPVTRTLKSDIWRRCTDEEAELLEAALNAAPVRLRRLFDDSTILESNWPEYETLRAGIVGAVGEERAAELLAAS
jgi:hypothetical protein